MNADRGYQKRKASHNRMYAPCKTGKDVSEQQVSDTKYWVAKIRFQLRVGDVAVTNEMIAEAKAS